jgi:2-amino-4-hydroxy-6-hydroxymethyldihydropteridine diphosphokinase
VALAYLGIGSNLGDREGQLRAAVAALTTSPDVAVLRASPLYETEPVGLREQPWFLNGVLEVETTLAPDDLRAAVKRLEVEQGRRAGVHWGPRMIDVDILLYDSLQVRTDTLTIPHTELWNRRFVLVPLADLRADLAAPGGVPSRGRIAQGEGTERVRAWPPEAEWPPAALAGRSAQRRCRRTDAHQ